MQQWKENRKLDIQSRERCDCSSAEVRGRCSWDRERSELKVRVSFNIAVLRGGLMVQA